MTLPSYLLWIDLETTGLDANVHKVVEIYVQQMPFDDPFGSAFDDPFGSAPCPARVIRSMHRVLCWRGWDSLEDDVVKMHACSGLLDECRRSTTTREEVESDLFSTFVEHSLGDKFVLAGSSVHFDLGFVRKHFPVFAKYLSHRVYDVSALKLFCCSIGMPYEKGESAHRARADVMASMATARQCHDWLVQNFGDKRELELRRKHVLTKARTKR